MESRSSALAHPLAGLAAALDALVGIDMREYDDRARAEVLKELATARAKLAAVELHVLSASEEADTAAKAGHSSTAAWAAQVTRADGAATARRVRLAERLEGCPATGRALSAGEISPDHAGVIAATAAALPSHLTDAERRVVEEKLLAKARRLAPKRLRQEARRALEAVEPDPEEVDADEDAQLASEEERALARTRMVLHDNGDGTISGRFTVPHFAGSILKKLVDALAAPRRQLLREQATDADGVTDWGKARGLALTELLEHLPADKLYGRVSSTVVVTIDFDALTEKLRAARLDTGEKISAGEARRIACGAGLVPAVLGGDSVALDLGRTRRLFNGNQRLALGIRYETCAHDGCDRPFEWCELHHLEPWSHGGSTDLANAVPLCRWHHAELHRHPETILPHLERYTLAA